MANISSKKKNIKSIILQKQKKKEEKSEKEIKNIKNENKQKIEQNENKKMAETMNGFYNEKRKFFLTSDGQKGKKKYRGNNINNEGNNINNNLINKNINNSFTKKHFKTENNKINDSFGHFNCDLNSIDKEILSEINNKTVNTNLKRFQQKKLIDLEISKNRDKLIKTNGFNGTENLLMNIKNIMNELLYRENPKQIIDKVKDSDKESISKTQKTYPYLERFKDYEKIRSMDKFKTINKNINRPFTSMPKISYGKDYKDISNKIMNDIDNIITKVNEIDLHDFSTDQNYKDKRKLNLFSKMDKEKVEKRNSIDSLLIKEKNNESSFELEEDEKDEEEDEK